MHIMEQRTLGVLILVLLAALVVVKRVTTGAILERPEGGLLLWLVNIFNLFFLLIANPLAAVLLISGDFDGIDPTAVMISPGWLQASAETLGVMVYLLGFVLMGWALISLRTNYQLGGSRPRVTDRLVTSGPYAFIRHPMYTAALCIAFGLACLIGSLGCSAAFVIYLLLILRLLPFEEERLLHAYGDHYATYQQNVKKLVPFLF